MWKWLTGLFGSQAVDPAAGIAQAQHKGKPQAQRAGSRQTDWASSQPDLAALRKILDIFQVKLPPAELPFLLAELKRGQKIDAIKRIRTEGSPRLGLKEAKDIVDACDALNR